MIDGLSVPEETPAARAGGYMERLLRRLEADIDARKRPRTDPWPLVRRAAAFVFVCAVAFELGARSSQSPSSWLLQVEARDRLQGMNSRVDALQGEIDIQKAHIERLERVQALSTKYGIGADLAMAIEDIALSEGVDPNLAFELVRVESEFTQRAVSPVGALGYTQLMPATARILQPGITRAQIFDRDTNLRLGFRFFRSLINQYNGDVRLALLAYNRGPVTVDRLLAQGLDPSNGYAKLVLGR